uniref:Plexin cytoplasmic RasGAP domain-containing protein n=1 Tax=Xiphophorus couchianus TaxID=32473 RepID=A0A3B5L3E8_9TELE
MQKSFRLWCRTECFSFKTAGALYESSLIIWLVSKNKEGDVKKGWGGEGEWGVRYPVLSCLFKVAVHSYVENLFRSIWGVTQSKAPLAIKYFFDFLDAQAENMKITDPEVRHIWKTNSLPLRFWINILKNPQFVFDMEKTPHLDGCLSVVAQAFMDSFSLSETQLGKHAPTNKLLYAKDIPKFKQEVKAYYKQIREQPAVSDAEFKDFLKGESKVKSSLAQIQREMYVYH